jgi:transcriptional regulator with XRE-family HTH domain
MQENKASYTLADLRAERGLTLLEVAALTGLSDAEISLLERSLQPRPRLVTIAKLAQGLGLDEERVRAMLRASILDAAIAKAGEAS